MGTTAEKLKRVLATKNAIREAIRAKGGEVFDEDSFYSYAEKIEALKGGEGGDFIYAKNLTGKEPEAGEKVLLSMNNTANGVFSDEIQRYNITTFFCFDDDVIVAIDQFRYNDTLWRKYQWDEEASAYVLTASANLGVYPNLSFPFFFDKEGRCYFHQANTANLSVVDYHNGVVLSSGTAYFEIGNDLVYECGTGVIYNKDKSLSFATGFGSFANNQKMLQVFENTLVLSTTNQVMYVDFSNFPECVTQTITSPVTGALNYGLTGKDIGDYFVLFSGGMVLFLRRTEEGFETEFSRVCYANPYFNHKDGVVSGYDSGKGELFAYRFDFETKVWNDIILPEDVVYQAGYLPGKTYTQFVTNKTGSAMAFYKQTDGSNDVRAWYKLYKTVYGIGKPVFRECDRVYFGKDTSLTGFVTGVVDGEGNYEVKTALPEVVDITLSVLPDVDEEQCVIERTKIQ